MAAGNWKILGFEKTRLLNEGEMDHQTRRVQSERNTCSVSRVEPRRSYKEGRSRKEHGHYNRPPLLTNGYEHNGSK